MCILSSLVYNFVLHLTLFSCLQDLCTPLWLPLQKHNNQLNLKTHFDLTELHFCWFWFDIYEQTISSDHKHHWPWWDINSSYIRVQNEIAWQIGGKFRPVIGLMTYDFWKLHLKSIIEISLKFPRFSFIYSRFSQLFVLVYPYRCLFIQKFLLKLSEQRTYKQSEGKKQDWLWPCDCWVTGTLWLSWRERWSPETRGPCQHKPSSQLQSPIILCSKKCIQGGGVVVRVCTGWRRDIPAPWRSLRQLISSLTMIVPVKINAKIHRQQLVNSYTVQSEAPRSHFRSLLTSFQTDIHFISQFGWFMSDCIHVEL